MYRLHNLQSHLCTGLMVSFIIASMGGGGGGGCHKVSHRLKRQKKALWGNNYMVCFSIILYWGLWITQSINFINKCEIHCVVYSGHWLDNTIIIWMRVIIIKRNMQSMDLHNTVKPVLMATCIQRPPVLRGHSVMSQRSLCNIFDLCSKTTSLQRPLWSGRVIQVSLYHSKTPECFCYCIAIHHSSPVKPKLDLLKTCVAAIPRIMPADMTRDDLIDLLSRLAIHMDHELVRTTFISLQNIITNFPSWRHHVTKIFALFILRDIPDSCPLILEAALKKLIQMVTHWKSLIGSEAQVIGGAGSSCT